MAKASEFSEAVRYLIDLRAGGRCEVSGRITDEVQYHHRRPRGMGGTSRPETGMAANGLRVALDIHELIEGRNGGSRVESLRHGWLVEQNADPEACRVELWDGWFLLNNQGRRKEVKARKGV